MSDSKISLKIKIVGGQGCTLAVEPDVTITSLKNAIEPLLNIPSNQQTLLHKGRPLLDYKKISDYKVPSGATLYLMKSRLTKKIDVLFTEMKKFLAEYFEPAVADKIALQYMKVFYQGLNVLSLDDFERIAARYLEAPSQM